MGALLVLWLRPVPAEMEPFFTGPNNNRPNDMRRYRKVSWRALKVIHDVYG